MKQLFYLTWIVVILFSSCKPTAYLGAAGQAHQTQVLLKEANFKVLGSFTGTATERKSKVGIKNNIGVYSQAKINMLENAKNAGAELKGNRALINVITDYTENSNRVTVTYSADIIEFIK